MKYPTLALESTTTIGKHWRMKRSSYFIRDQNWLLIPINVIMFPKNFLIIQFNQVDHLLFHLFDRVSTYIHILLPPNWWYRCLKLNSFTYFLIIFSRLAVFDSLGYSPMLEHSWTRFLRTQAKQHVHIPNCQRIHTKLDSPTTALIQRTHFKNTGLSGNKFSKA